jgi:deoxyribodipyrimidine photolyase-related protein
MKNSNPTFLIYPHQLFENTEALNSTKVFLIEDPIFFTLYNFHKQKIILHRASMKFYEDYLITKNITVEYISSDLIKETQDISTILEKSSVKEVCFYELHDDWLHKRLTSCLEKLNIKYSILKTPMFLTDIKKGKDFFSSKKNYFFTSFYIFQRQSLKILIEKDLPVGGKWTFDGENRKKIPKGLQIPQIIKFNENQFVKEAKIYVNKFFNNNPGEVSNFNFPTTFEESRKALKDFLENRLSLFGDYEDAIVEESQTNFHSVLTPALNIGLITPLEVVNKTLEYSKKNEISLNSLEGFIRQIIGWREYMRIVYENLGKKQRTSNFFNHKKKIPQSFYDGTTGIYPIDQTIKNLLRYSYSHHIERLMILGNFMLLSRFDPNEIHRWFMELYIDAYDWVMVPNVYGMSQFADGGLTTTKPYISSSNYVLKMSNYKKDNWSNTWDALYWEFLGDNLDFFSKNPRSMMMVSQFKKLNPNRKLELQTLASQYLQK